jgi:hypothetical protein
MLSCTKNVEVLPTDVKTHTDVQTRDDQTTDDNQNSTDLDNPVNPSTDIQDSAEFKASLKTLKTAELKLSQAGHKIPVDLDIESPEWSEHEIEIEIGLNKYKKIPWEIGYVVFYYRNFVIDLNLQSDPVFKFLDENSWPSVRRIMNDYLDAAEAHFQTYSEDLEEKTRDILKAKHLLVSQTFSDYESHLSEIQERSKITEMTWGEILQKYSITDIILCDKELDLISVSSWFNNDSPELRDVIQNGKVKLLEKESSTLFNKEKTFKVYNNLLLFIQ